MKLKEKVRDRMGEWLGVPVTALADEVMLQSVVPDSFGMVDMVIELQESFGVTLHSEDLATVKNVGDLLGLIELKGRTHGP